MRSVSAAFAAVAAWALACAPACHADAHLCGTPADAFFAERIGLLREWIVQLPFDSAAYRLEHVTVADGIVVAAAGDGSLHAIAAGPAEPGMPAPGTILWSRRFPRGEGHIRAPAVGSGIVVVAGDFRAFGIDVQTGRTVWEEALRNPPTATAGISGEWVYLPVENGRMVRMAVNPYRAPTMTMGVAATRQKGETAKKTPDPATERPRPLPAAERVKPVEIDAHGRVEMPPLPFKGGMLWCTTEGLITAFVPAYPEWNRLEFDLGRPAAGTLLIREASIFVATNAGASASDVVRIDALPIGLVYAWRTPLRDAVSGGARLSGDTLLVPLAAGGMAGLSTDDGSRLWLREQPFQLLAISKERLWGLDATARLATLDPADGMRLQQFCLGPFRLPVVNTGSDRLILASPGGTVTSLASLAAGVPTPADKPSQNPAE